MYYTYIIYHILYFVKFCHQYWVQSSKNIDIWLFFRYNNHIGCDTMTTFYTLFIYFFIYSILGWCVEMIYCRICQKKWVDRGFLFGPYCPIYGFGAIAAIVAFEPLLNHWLWVFVLASIGATILEYIVSYVLEKLFGATWWDYSHLPFNLNGRVCLLNSVEFGLLALVVLYFVQPGIASLVGMIPLEYIHYIVTGLLIILVIDFMSTLNAIVNLKEKLQYLQSLGEKIREKANSKVQDSELVKQLEEMKKDFIYQKDNLKNRLINAFPTMSFPKFKASFDELKSAVEKYNQALQTRRKQKQLPKDEMIKQLQQEEVVTEIVQHQEEIE